MKDNKENPLNDIFIYFVHYSHLFTCITPCIELLEVDLCCRAYIRVQNLITESLDIPIQSFHLMIRVSNPLFSSIN